MALAVAELQKRQGPADPAVAQSAHVTAAEIAAAGESATTDHGNARPEVRTKTAGLPAPLGLPHSHQATPERALALPGEQRVVHCQGGPLTIPKRQVVPRTEWATGERARQPRVVEGRCRVTDSGPGLRVQSGEKGQTAEARAAYTAQAAQEESQRPSARPRSASTATETKASVRTFSLAGHTLYATDLAPQRPKPAGQPMRTVHSTSQASGPRLADTKTAHELGLGLKKLLAGFFDTPGVITWVESEEGTDADDSVDLWEGMAWLPLLPFRFAKSLLYLVNHAPSRRTTQRPITARAPVAQEKEIPTAYPPMPSPVIPRPVWVSHQSAPDLSTSTRPSVTQEETAAGPAQPPRSEPLRPEVERIPTEPRARPSFYQIIPVRPNPALGSAQAAGHLAPGILFSEVFGYTPAKIRIPHSAAQEGQENSRTVSKHPGPKVR